jgi:CHAT domain-containing protein
MFRRPLLVGPDDPTIPWAGHEVAAIAAILPNATVLKGKRATVRAFARQAPRCDCLHLATHGIFRSDNPSFSSLRLADGWITVADLKETCRSARLVTMSACESGVTDVRAGDEILGLSRAVLGAGAASLVASFWPVHDESAARLMTAFYRRLSQGDSLAASLRAAMAEQRRATDHPYFWAPFALIGSA